MPRPGQSPKLAALLEAFAARNGASETPFQQDPSAQDWESRRRFVRGEERVVALVEDTNPVPDVMVLVQGRVVLVSSLSDDLCIYYRGQRVLMTPPTEFSREI